MPTLNVVFGVADHGQRVAPGVYEFVKSDDGLPAMRFRWQGFLFKGSEATFVFARDVIAVTPCPDETLKQWVRIEAFGRASDTGAKAGIVGATIFGAAAAAGAPTAGLKGLTVIYKNPQGHGGMFIIAASPPAAEEIIRSLPPERFRPHASSAS